MANTIKTIVYCGALQLLMLVMLVGCEHSDDYQTQKDSSSMGPILGYSYATHLSRYSAIAENIMITDNGRLSFSINRCRFQGKEANATIYGSLERKKGYYCLKCIDKGDSLDAEFSIVYSDEVPQNTLEITYIPIVYMYSIVERGETKWNRINLLNTVHIPAYE